MPLARPSGLLLALLLRLLPLPPGWFALSPDWLALLLLQGSLQAPGRVGILTAWLFGLPGITPHRDQKQKNTDPGTSPRSATIHILIVILP